MAVMGTSGAGKTTLFNALMFQNLEGIQVAKVAYIKFVQACSRQEEGVMIVKGQTLKFLFNLFESKSGKKNHKIKSFRLICVGRRKKWI